MFSADLEKTLKGALEGARRRRHEYMTLEHLLYSLCDDSEGAKVLHGCEVDTDKVMAELEKFFNDELSSIKLKTAVDPSPTAAVQRVLQRAVIHVQASGKDKVTAADVLVALFSERESFAVHCLHDQEMNRYDAVLYISHDVSPGDKQLTRSDQGDEQETRIERRRLGGGRSGKKTPDPIEKWCIDLNKKAADGKIDPLIAREDEMKRIIQILCRRTKNNPLLVGDAGVGKTAIVEGLALAIVEKKVPPIIAAAKLYSLDMGSLLAGTRYRGDFEERLKLLFTALKKDKNAIAFIDEMHTVVGAGATGGGAMDASNLLKPILAKGEMRCIGATTYKEFRNHMEKDRALSRRFQKVDIAEPSRQDAIKIIKGLKGVYEDYHRVKYTAKAVADAVMLSSRYIGERKLPDKAIDVIDEAGARQALKTAAKRRKIIHSADIEKIVAEMARVPTKQVSSRDSAALEGLEGHLRRVIHGQNKALTALSDAVKLSKVGLREEGKPIGCYLFTGPTGVGKTETARQLAMTMGIGLIRFDMSEYMERHAVSRLIGTPPGYVGFEQGGLLTEEVEKQPHAVLLLDEVEKAHGDILNLLLQVMDYGKLTDNNGNTVDFANIILIMTSNVGGDELEKTPIGFLGDEDEQDTELAVKRVFSPEFRNRLDAVIAFAALNMPTMEKIVEKSLFALEAQLAERKISLELTVAARKFLAAAGFDRKFGARPLSRVIQEKLKKPMAEEILFGKLKNGGTVKIDLKANKKLSFVIKADRKPRQMQKA